jgi:phosphonate ABC transporter permease subunit PhnE
MRWWLVIAIYALAITGSLKWLSADDGLSLGRQPLQNLIKTGKELLKPSFLDVLGSNERIEYRSDDGRVLRVEDKKQNEVAYLDGMVRAVVVTLAIATVGTGLAALISIPFGILAAQNLGLPPPVQRTAQAVLNVSRSIHSLVFGLFLVGIVGLGPMAGILAIALHSFGTLGKLMAETIETLDLSPALAVRSTGASWLQTLAWGVIPNFLPAWISSILYVWEFNIRDSTVLGLVGAGGLGLLISESISLFQWGRLATVLLVIVMLVITFDAVSRRVRMALQ